MGVLAGVFMLRGVVSMAEAVPGGEAPLIPERLSLEAAVAIAREWNPRINQAREIRREQDGALEATRSSGLPQIDLTGVYWREEEGRAGGFGGPERPDQDFWRVGVELNQALYSGGILAAAVRGRRLRNEALDLDVAAHEARVVADVHRAFYQVLLARDAIAVQEESITLFLRQLDLARNRYEAGSGARFDVLQAEVQVANARPPLIRAKNQYRLARERLRTALGVPASADRGDGASWVLEGELTFDPLAIDLDTALDQARELRPEKRALDRLMAAAEQDVLRARSQRKPRVGFFANYGIEKDRFEDEADTLEGWQAGVEARMPLWEGWRIRGETAQAVSRSLQTTWQAEALGLDIDLEVRNAWMRAWEARDLVEAVEQVIVQAEEAVRLAENRYRAGALTQLDVLSTQLDLTRARLERITAVHDFLVAEVDLRLAMGTLGLENLAE
ncbi:MAG TPA: TolC family protein [Kiritimatiellia bacterium]|nr:TolC family protein [Kiritimatiellia bacterium]